MIPAQNTTAEDFQELWPHLTKELSEQAKLSKEWKDASYNDFKPGEELLFLMQIGRSYQICANAAIEDWELRKEKKSFFEANPVLVEKMEEAFDLFTLNVSIGDSLSDDEKEQFLDAMNWWEEDGVIS